MPACQQASRPAGQQASSPADRQVSRPAGQQPSQSARPDTAHGEVILSHGTMKKCSYLAVSSWELLIRWPTAWVPTVCLQMGTDPAGQQTSQPARSGTSHEGVVLSHDTMKKFSYLAVSSWELIIRWPMAWVPILCLQMIADPAGQQTSQSARSDTAHGGSDFIS